MLRRRAADRPRRSRTSYFYDQSAGAACRFAPDPMPDCVNALNSSTVARRPHRRRRRSGHAGLQGRGARRRAAAAGSTRSTPSTSGSPGRRCRRSATTPSRPGCCRSSRRSRSATSWPTTARARTPTTPSPRACTASSSRTAISRRWRFVEPYMSFWYMYPIARGDSLFKDYGPAQTMKNPMQQGGTVVRRRAGAVRAPRRRAQDLDRPARAASRGTSSDAATRRRGSCSRRRRRSSATRRRRAFNPACIAARRRTRTRTSRSPASRRSRATPRSAPTSASACRSGRHARFRTAFEYTHDEAHIITGEDIGVPMTASGARDVGAERVQPGLPRERSTRSGGAIRVDNVDTTTSRSGAQVQF